MKAQKGGGGLLRYSSTHSLTLALDGGGWSDANFRLLYPLERDPVPII
jgi:hypothetical protein